MTQSTQPADMSKSDAVIDKYEAIRKALAAGPTPGPWHHDAATDTVSHVLTGNWIADCQKTANAALIAACDPATLTSLLADANRARELEEDARRYRWLRDNPWPPELEADILLHRNARWDDAIDRAQGETR